jgi:hypothetical protein
MNLDQEPHLFLVSMNSGVSLKALDIDGSKLFDVTDLVTSKDLPQ